MLKHAVLSTLLFCLIGMHSYGQMIKKKYLGSFSGNLQGYTMLVGEKLIEVEATTISIAVLANGNINELIGSSKNEGTYRITSETKSTFTIQVNYPNQLLYEELILDKKAKTIQRKGFYPQPDCELKKD